MASALDDKDGGGGEFHAQDVIVIDCGSGMIKAGWAGEDAPRVVVPALVLDVGQALPAHVMESTSLRADESYVGHDALAALHASTNISDGSAAGLRVISPIKRGQIQDWDAMERIWDHIFTNELRVNPMEHPVLLTSLPLSTKEAHAEMARIMFGKFKVPALCICNQAVLSLFACGRTTGIVLEVGEGVTHAVPIFEGFALTHSILRMRLAGGDLTRYLMQILAERGINFSDSHLDIVRDIKEKLCVVRLQPYTGEEAEDSEEDEDQGMGGDDNTSGKGGEQGGTGSGEPDKTRLGQDIQYELPDGQVIRIDDHCRFNTPELLFNPDLRVSQGFLPEEGLPEKSGEDFLNQLPKEKHSSSHMSAQGGGPKGAEGDKLKVEKIVFDEVLGAHEMLYKSIMQCDALLRKDLLKNIVLAGGTSMMAGFGERMKRELQQLVGPHEVIDVVQDSQRKLAAWIGGSMYASLPTFEHIQITRSEYQAEQNIVHKKMM